MSQREGSDVKKKILRLTVYGLAVIGSIGFVVAAGLILFWAFLVGMGGGQWG